MARIPRILCHYLACGVSLPLIFLVYAVRWLLDWTKLAPKLILLRMPGGDLGRFTGQFIAGFRYNLLTALSNIFSYLFKSRLLLILRLQAEKNCASFTSLRSFQTFDVVRLFADKFHPEELGKHVFLLVATLVTMKGRKLPCIS
jgi:hypothetical protein